MAASVGTVVTTDTSARAGEDSPTSAAVRTERRRERRRWVMRGS
jgi:hypothetical protein